MPRMMDAEELLGLLRLATRECVRGSSRVAVAYSGGLDSAVVDALASEVAHTVRYTCGVSGSHDLTRADMHASDPGTESRPIDIDRARLESMVRKAGMVLRTADPVRISYTIPVLCVVEAAHEDIVLVGSGADELFGGYARYLEDPDAPLTMKKDTEKMLAEIDLLGSYALSAGKRLKSPFVSHDVIVFASRLHLSRKLGPGGRKIVLREVAGMLGLESRDRPKQAAQYSSGVMKEMKRAARDRKMTLGEWTAETVGDARRIP